MLIKQALLVLIGLSGAGFVAAGTFAFITMLGIVPRLAARTDTARRILWYENLIIAGGALANFIHIREVMFDTGNFLRGSVVVLILFGVFSGMFVGCLAMALAELLQVIPVFAKRIRMRTGAPTGVRTIGADGRRARKGMVGQANAPAGMPFVVLAIALGKMAGSFAQTFFGW